MDKHDAEADGQEQNRAAVVNLRQKRLAEMGYREVTLTSAITCCSGTDSLTTAAEVDVVLVPVES